MMDLMVRCPPMLLPSLPPRWWSPSFKKLNKVLKSSISDSYSYWWTHEQIHQWLTWWFAEAWLCSLGIITLMAAERHSAQKTESQHGCHDPVITHTCSRLCIYAYRDLRTTYTQRRLTYFCISSGLNPPMPKSFSYTINFLGTSVSNPFPIPIIIPALFLRLPVIIDLCLIQFLGFKHLPHPASSPRPTILTCTNPPP